MTRLLRGIAIAVGPLVLIAALAGPAAAAGFEEFTVEEIDENTATCDFDGDGIYTDYWVTPDQTVLQKSQSHVDGRGITHVKVITIFDNIEYTEATASPPVFYNTAKVVFSARLDGDTLLSLEIRNSGAATDAAGNVLYVGPGNFEITVVDGDLVGFTTRGKTGPCIPGI